MDVITSLTERFGSHPWHGSQLAHESLLAARDNITTNSTSTEDFAPASQRMLTAWVGLQLAGQISLPILIATLLFHKRIARRNPTIVNLCIVWTLATVPPELLFYTGQYKGPMPSTLLCLFQASTISAVPPMAAMAYLAVVIHACTVIHDLIRSNTPRPFALDLRMVFLLGSPYITFFAFALMIAVIGSRNPNDVQRSLFFCEVIHHKASIPVFSFAVLVVILTLSAQAWIAVMFYRNYMTRRRRNMDWRTNPRPLLNVSAMDIQLLIRMVAFTVFEVVIVISSISAIFLPNMYAAQLLFATPPIAVFIIFSSSRDIYAAWFPCLFRQRNFSTSKPSPSETDESQASSFSHTPRPPSTISRYSQASRASLAGQGRRESQGYRGSQGYAAIQGGAGDRGDKSGVVGVGLAAPAPAKVKDSWASQEASGRDVVDLEKGFVTVPLVGSGERRDVRDMREVRDTRDVPRGRPGRGSDIPDDTGSDRGGVAGKEVLVLYQKHEHSTVMVVDGSNLPTPESPLHAIRALRTSSGSGGRLKPRTNYM